MPKDPNALTLRLRALHGGAYTDLRLSGPVATIPQRAQVRRVLSVLSLWHGGPVDVALYVDGSAGWLEIWDEALVAVPRWHATLRFLLRRPAQVGRDHDEP